MSIIEEFLKRNNITPQDPLPLIHTTEMHKFISILKNEIIDVQPCNVFKSDSLNYFFVGRPAYKRHQDIEPKYWELPSCIVLAYSTRKPKRVFPFDSGAFKNNFYPEYISCFKLEDYDAGGSVDSPSKIIGTFFSSRRDYYSLKPRREELFKNKFDISIIDHEIQALYDLIKEKSGKSDDRRFAIEIQYDEQVKLKEEQVLAVIVPDVYLKDQKFIELTEQTGCEIITYPYYPLRKEYFYYAIYEKLDNFYTERNLY